MPEAYSRFLRRVLSILTPATKYQKRGAMDPYPLSNFRTASALYFSSLCKPEHVINDIDRGIQPTSTKVNQLPVEELSTGQDTQTLIQNQGNHELNHSPQMGVNSFYLKLMVTKFLWSISFSRLCQTTSIDEALQDSGLLKMACKAVFSNLSAVMLGILVICYNTAMQFLILLPKKKTQYRASLSTESTCGHKGDHGCKGKVSMSFIWYAFGDGIFRKAKLASSEAKQSSQSVDLIYLIMTNCISFD